MILVVRRMSGWYYISLHYMLKVFFMVCSLVVLSDGYVMKQSDIFIKFFLHISGCGLV